MILRYFLFFTLLCGQLLAQYTPGGGGGSGSVPKIDILSFDKSVNGGTPAYATGKNVTLTNSAASQTLLNYSGRGYVSKMWIAVSGATVSGQYVRMKITVDGSVIYNNSHGYFFADGYWHFDTRTSWGTAMAADFSGQTSEIPIPFSTSIKIELTNTEPSNNLSLWWTISYVTGVSPSVWLNSGHLNVNVQSDSDAGGLTLSQDQVGTLFNATGLNPGRLLGLFLIFEGVNADGPGFLEGPISIYADGNLILSTSGTEDYFGMAGYFGAVNPGGVFDSYVALMQKRGGPPLYVAVRWHLPDPILFQNALKITWQAGLSSSGNTFNGTVKLYWCAWYYTQ